MLLFWRKHLKIAKKDIKTILAFSFFEPFLYFIFETYSLQNTSASVVSIIIATIPLFTALLSRYYFKETFTSLNMIGVLVSLIGIAVMLGPTIFGDLYGLKGVLLAFCAVFAAVGYAYFLRKLADQYHPVVITAYQNTIGIFLFLPLFFILNRNEALSQLSLSFEPHNLGLLLILAVFCSALAFVFFVKGLQQLGLGKSNVFNNLIPVATAIVSYFVLGEQFPLYKITGMIIVIVGVFLVQKKSIVSQNA